MVDFTAELDSLVQDFETHGIPIGTPGFYDHEAFVRVEQKNPQYLNNYARFVSLRAYDSDYLDRARTEIPVVAQALHGELVEDGRQGACVDTSGVLSKALEREGFWNFVVKGSLTMDFPSRSGIGKRFFWTVDEGEFVAAHTWVFAPPFAVVDVTIRQQGHSQNEYAHLPNIVLAESPAAATAEIDDVIAPDVRAFLALQGVPRAQFFRAINPTMVRFFEVFPACRVTAGEMALKYVPTAVGAPDCPLEEMIGLSQESRNGIEIYEQVIVPALKQRRGRMG